MSENTFRYFMESAREASRLLTKATPHRDRAQLLEMGIDALPPIPTIVDAGAGVGVVAESMSAIASTLYRSSTLILIDGSDERLNAAKQHVIERENVARKLLAANLDQIPLETASVDFVFCRFVLEYVSSPQAIIAELVRILRPGGKLVLGDLDYNSLTHYPLPRELSEQMKIAVTALESSGAIDPYVGRKLPTWAHQAGLESIDVRVLAHHSSFGPATAAEVSNWRAKLDQLESVDLPFDWREFSARFTDFLGRSDRFSYTPLILVGGSKPC